MTGLGIVLFPSATPGDIDRFFYGVASELAYPQHFGTFNTGTTKASDVHAFAAGSREVSSGFVVPP